MFFVFYNITTYIFYCLTMKTIYMNRGYFPLITLAVKLGFFWISTGVFCTQHISGIYITFVRRLAIFLLHEICTETSMTASVTYER